MSGRRVRRSGASVELCAELGGVYLVHGSPAQRRVADASDRQACGRGLGIAAEASQKAGVVYCLEPLAQPDCNFINTLAEASAVVQHIGNPAFKSMIDTLASSLMESGAGGRRHS